MRRSSSFLIGFAAAAITFGSLAAFVGPPHFANRGFYSYRGYGEGRYHCDGDRNDNRDKSGDVQKDQKTTPSDSSNY